MEKAREGGDILNGLAKAIAIAALCCLLGGCSVYQPNVESLLSAPMLSDLQDQVDSALRDVVGQDVKLKYPASGEYRSPYVFYDLDEDGAKEAVALYSLQEDTTPYLQILDSEGDVWRAGNALPASGDNVDFVSFLQLLKGETNLVVGWRDSEQAANHLSIYRCSGNQLTKIYEGNYSKVATIDYNGDGIHEIVAAQNYGNGTDLVLIGGLSDGTVGMLDSAHASNGSQQLSEPVVGKISPKLTGIVLDGTVSSRGMMSLLVGIENGKLVLPQESSDGAMYTQTLRYTGVHSSDINGDGIIEIPTGTLAAGYSDLSGTDTSAQYFTEYYQFDNGRFKYITTAYEDSSDGYRFFLPDNWNSYYKSGRLSVYRQAEYREVTFFLYGGSLNDRSGELLKLRVAATSDYLDQFDSQNYTKLAKRGQFEYYFYLPTGTLSDDTINSCFQLEN